MAWPYHCPPRTEIDFFIPLPPSHCEASPFLAGSSCLDSLCPGLSPSSPNCFPLLSLLSLWHSCRLVFQSWVSGPVTPQPQWLLLETIQTLDCQGSATVRDHVLSLQLLPHFCSDFLPTSLDYWAHKSPLTLLSLLGYPLLPTSLHLLIPWYFKSNLTCAGSSQAFG